MSGIRPPDCSKLAKNPKNDNDVTIFWHDVNIKFFWRCFLSLVKFSSSLVLELWQFSFIRDWPEIRKSEIPPSELCPRSGDWGKLWIPHLARMSLIEYYWKLYYDFIGYQDNIWIFAILYLQFVFWRNKKWHTKQLAVFSPSA